MIVLPLLCGNFELAIAESKAFTDWLLKHYHQGTEIVCLCSGAFTGLLNGRKCSVHWAVKQEFAGRFPAINIVEVTYKIERTDGKPFYIAGLWDIWIDIKTNVLFPTFVIITMPPNSAMSEIHDRMPAILERNDIKNWLDGNQTGTARVNYLRSYPCPPEHLKITIHKKG